MLLALTGATIALVIYYISQKQPDRDKTTQAIEARVAAGSIIKNDPVTAFSVLRENITDTSYPALQRGITTAYIADVFTIKTSRSPEFAHEYIFIGDPFASFLDGSIPDENRRVADGIRRMYEYSLQFSLLLPQGELAFHLLRFGVQAGGLRYVQ